MHTNANRRASMRNYTSVKHTFRGHELEPSYARVPYKFLCQITVWCSLWEEEESKCILNLSKHVSLSGTCLVFPARRGRKRVLYKFEDPGAVALLEFCERSEQDSSIYVTRIWCICAIGRLCWVIYGSIKCPADLWILWILTHFSKCIYQMVAHWSIYQMRCTIDQMRRSIKRAWHINLLINLLISLLIYLSFYLFSLIS